jgi:hypothetical protein
VKDEAAKDGTPSKMDGDQVALCEDKDKAAKTTDGVRKEGGKHHSREVSRERRDRRRSAGSSHYSHHSRSPNSQRHGPRHHISPSRKPGVLTFAQIRVSVEDIVCHAHNLSERFVNLMRNVEIMGQK